MLGGVDGTGKTTNARILCNDLAWKMGILDSYKVLVIDYENPRAQDNIDRIYPNIKDHFKVLPVLVKTLGRPTQINNVSKKDLFADFNMISIDWLASLNNIRDNILPFICDNLKDFDFLIADGIFSPTIKQLGEARWNVINADAKRDDPNQLDHVEIAKFETIHFRNLQIAAQYYQIPLICTGKMKDVYERDQQTKQVSKTGQVEFYCNKECAGELTLKLELIKPPIRRRATASNKFTVNCYKASAVGGFGWTDDLIPGYIEKETGKRFELYDILERQGEIEGI